MLKLHIQLIEATGGSQGIRDEKLLESALEAPFQTFGDVNYIQAFNPK